MKLAYWKTWGLHSSNIIGMVKLLVCSENLIVLIIQEYKSSDTNLIKNNNNFWPQRQIVSISTSEKSGGLSIL